jgi:hypothetical protein
MSFIDSPLLGCSPNFLENSIKNEDIQHENKKNPTSIIDVSYAINIVQELYTKYENDPYMALKTHNYICNQLPNVLQNTFINRQLRIMRTEELTTEHDSFIESFLTNNKYFYVPSTDKFFYYSGIQYKLYSEDEILHHILSSITKDRNLVSWKYKTKTSVMKRIKENLLIKTVPESQTIQRVIMSLYPAFFATKTEVKYFLTVLGDNIFKKNPNLIHFLQPYTKNFIRSLNAICIEYLGINLLHTFKFKYHGHEYYNSRLLHFHESIKYQQITDNIIKEIGLDMLCVACHYSIRHDNSDEYVYSCQDSDLQSYVFYLKDLNIENLITIFINEYITFGNIDANINDCSPISWKNLQYLWKHFLTAKKLPTVVFQNPLKNILIEKMNERYIIETDSFHNIFSKFLPEIQQFITFWDTTMISDESEQGLEMDEIKYLFNKWRNTQHEKKNGINDEQMIDIIRYFYPDIIIESEKYIQYTRCTLWDKKNDIKIALEELYYNKNGCNMNISIYDAYLFYCKYHYYLNTNEIMSSSNDFILDDVSLPITKNVIKTNRPFIVNKSYFHKYISENLTEYVIDNTYISKIWFENH